MFLAGLVLGLIVLAVAVHVLPLLDRRQEPVEEDWQMRVPPYRARAAIRDVERQTIHAMLVAELATRAEDVDAFGPER